MAWSIDGVQWTLPCKIERVAEIRASEISGLMMDLGYFNDVQGTWYRYTVSIAAPRASMGEYYQVYEMLTAPVDGHTFVLPYNGSDVEITGRVESVGDTHHDLGDLGSYWYGTSFTVIANHPTKTMSLSEVLVRGRTPFPDAASIPDGEVWQANSGDWSHITTTDGHYYLWTESNHTLSDANLTDGDEVSY